MKQNRAQKNHDEHTNEIWQHPHILDLEGKILMSAKEVNIFKPNTNYDIHRQPDNLMFDYDNWKIYNCEYKGHGGRRKALVQLRESAAVLRRMFRNYDIVNLYIHDDYKIEEIK